jgi:branched-chain amino acid transport system ATP-binding protein
VNARPELASAALLDVERLAAQYGRIRALDGVSLRVAEGALVALIGANGAGKTTLLRTLSGIRPAVEGTVRFGGADLTRAPTQARVRAGLAQVPEGRQVFGPMSVEDNVRLGGYLRSKADVTRSLEHAYELFPVLRDKRGEAAGMLSGGQQQMLAIGRGLMAKPKIMLLDEPSLGLSPILVKEIFQIVRRLNKEQGVTIMLVEQNAKVALEVADYGYVMELGRIVMADTADRLLASKDVQEFYLGVVEETQRGQKRWKQKKTWR